METRVIRLEESFEEGIALGGRILREGGLVAFPTETVYGLGANALDGEAVRSIFAAKGRPSDNPLIAHVAEVEEAFALAQVDGRAEALLRLFWPGPLTVVLPKKPVCPDALTAGLPTVAIRMPSHEGARALIRSAGVPVAAPSANLSGRPSPTNARHVYEDMGGRIPLILDGGSCEWGLESTVLSLAGPPTILRPGAITPEQLSAVLGGVELAPSILSPLGEGEQAASPGMKYKHYSPKAEVCIADGEGRALPEAACEAYDTLAQMGKKCVIFASVQTSGFYEGRDCVIMGDREQPQSICRSLFALLREADAAGYEAIVLESLPPQALGLAFMNRALRAAGFHVVRHRA